MSPDEQAEVERTYAWLTAYMEAGFTRAEAMRMILVSLARPPAFNYPPEFSEWMTKQSRVAERMLEDE